MGGKSTPKKFDCVKFTREVRAQLYKETAHMTAEEKVDYYRNQTYTDPVLARLAAKARPPKEPGPAIRD